MNTLNFDKLYQDFQSFFTLCHYTDEALKNEILKQASFLEKNKSYFNHFFRGVIFKFDLSNDTITYLGYEK